MTLDKIVKSALAVALAFGCARGSRFNDLAKKPKEGNPYVINSRKMPCFYLFRDNGDGKVSPYDLKHKTIVHSAKN